MPLILERVNEDGVPERRPQDPEAPFPSLAESDPERASEAIAGIFRAGLTTREQLQDQVDISDQSTLVTALEQIVAVQLANDAWFRFFLTYEPAETIERVTVPVLAINGEKDPVVPHEENLREIEAALQRGGNTRYEIRAFPDLNHLFQHSETGAPSEYQSVEETWSVEVMEAIADWILKTAL